MPNSSSASSVNLSIIVCARNEAATVREILAALRENFPQAEIILVDNGSSDRTGELASQCAGVTVVQERTAGKGAALRTGAQAATGEWLLLHDADLEYTVEDAKGVVACAVEHDACCVGMRLVSYDHLFISSWLVNRLIQLIIKARLRIDMPDVLSGTRALRRDVFLSLNTTAVRFGIETELAFALAKKGVRCFSAPVRFSPRTYAQGKKIRVWHLLELIVQALK